jgi:hypothetical protein
MKKIKNKPNPFILWASPRTASSAFFYEYANRNNVKYPENDHEPLCPYGYNLNFTKRSIKNIEDVLKQNLSFKFMAMGYSQSSLEKWQIKKLYNSLPALDYHHIILFRKDVYARHKSFAFSMSTQIWHPKHIKSTKFDGWSKTTDFTKNHNLALGDLKQSLDKYVKLINFLKAEELEYQIIEFEDACSYIGKDTSQGTMSYYDEYEDLELKEKLEDLMNNHEFTKIWNT